jgi:hypothetical protein
VCGPAEFPQSKPCEHAGSISQRNAVGNGCNRSVLANSRQHPFNSVAVPSGTESQGPAEESRKPGPAKLIGPDRQRIGLLLNSVVIDYDHLKSETAGEMDCTSGIDSVVDGDKQVSTRL